jgi:hypothetical protein
MKTAYSICIVRFDNEGQVASRGPAELYRDREAGADEVRDYIAYDDRFGVDIAPVQVSDKKWKALRK